MIFTYQAINKDGKTEKDEIDAESYKAAVSIIHGMGLIPVDLKEKKQGLGVSFVVKFSGVSLQDKILFIQNLSIMLKAGISLTKSLKILSSQTNNQKFKVVLQEVYSQVEAGKSFAEALGKHPEVFQNIFVSMVRVGEISGNLDKSLEYLGVQLQREHDIISKTRGALIYPAVIVFAIFVVGLLLGIFVLPSLIAIFKDAEIELPLMTRIVIGIVDFLSENTLIVLGLLVAFVVGAVAAYRSKPGQRIFDQVLLKTPIFGNISKKVNMARFSRIMSSMLKSGTPILEGLQVCADSLGNIMYKEAIAKSLQDVKVGKGLAVSLSQYPDLFGYVITQMIGVGEESGTVDEILFELAQHYEAEVDDTMKNISSVIEPVLILIIGAVVGVLAVALISPIYSLTQQAG